MAAGATIGSNHNSRANENEIQAGRGFWPGLCTSVKHSCRFASFVLLSKADYPAELNIPLPFSLLNNNTSKDQLEVMPAYWWMYNMYALARNSWKFQNRDKRVHKIQNIEFETFAPDTIEEIFTARTLLEIWTAKASLGQKAVTINEQDLVATGRNILSGSGEETDGLEVLGENMENSRRKVLILKPKQAYDAYGDILHYYATKNLMAYMSSHSKATFSMICKDLKNKRRREWVNLGGQIMERGDVDKLRSDIGSGKLKSWKEIHARYDDLLTKYTIDKQKHAFATLCELYETENLTKTQLVSAMDKSVIIQKYICDQVYSSRQKDFENPYRQATFRNMDEMKAAFGTLEDNSFIIQVRRETKEFETLSKKLKKRIS